jgi:hypothetical protein
MTDNPIANLSPRTFPSLMILRALMIEQVLNERAETPTGVRL